MERLSGLDAAFLGLETESSHMHVAGLAIFDPSTAAQPVTVERLAEVYGGRLHLAPPFRRRLAPVPFGLHHPLWIEDPDFDIFNHLRHRRLPAPGGPDELSAAAAEMAAEKLDRSRPLWEITLLDGLEGDRIALYNKVHHAAIDGASGNELQIALLDLSPEVEEHVPDAEWQPDPIPTDAELLAYAAASWARHPERLIKALRRSARAALDVRRRGLESTATALPPSPFRAPRTSFNQAITPRRSFAFTSLDLREVKAVKAAAGTTVNDVVLAICGGALRRYLAERGERPAEPLVAMVPVSVRTEDQRGAMGNRVSFTLTSLATDVAHPLQRLAAVSEIMGEAKLQQQLIGADTLQQWTEFAAPAVLGRAARLYTRLCAANAHRPIFNVTISNVPGPPFPLYSAGARMLAHYPAGPIFDGAGLNITVMSYLDQLDVGILTCPDLLEDVWDLADDMHAALDELVEATRVREVELDAYRRAS